MMETLPRLFTDGGEIWLAAMVVSALAGAAFAAPTLRADALRSARRARRSLGEPLPSPLALREGDQVTLEGRIEAREALSLDAIRGAALAVARCEGTGRREVLRLRTPGLALRVGGERVALDGPIAILAGSIETAPTPLSRMTLGFREALIEADVAASMELSAGDLAVVVRAVGDGARVRVQGTVRRGAGATEGAGYRQSAASWSLAAAEEGGAVSLAACGMPAVRGIGFRARALAALVTLGVATLVSLTAGEIAFRIAESALHPGGPLPSRLLSARIAAATPLRRDQTLALAAARLEGPPAHHDADATLEAAALAELRRGCARAVAVLVDHGQVDRAAGLPDCRRRDALERLAEARYERAEYGAASLLLDRLDSATIEQGPPGAALGRSEAATDVFVTTVHLLAGRLDRAAERARSPRMARRSFSDRTLRCVADWMDVRRGREPEAALDRLRDAADAPGLSSVECWLLLADAGSAKMRSTVLRDGSGWRLAHLDNVPSLERLLRREEGLDSKWSPDAPTPDCAIRHGYLVRWLMYGRQDMLLLDMIPDAIVPGDNRKAAVAASALGAHALAVRLDGPGLSHEGYDWSECSEDHQLRSVIERRSRAGSFHAERSEKGWDCEGPLMAWRADHDGDGAALAKTLDEHPEEADHAYLMADLVTRGREELFAWLRWGPRATRARTLVGLAAELENRRIFAQAIGDHEAEAELAAIVARHREALLRRDIAVPLGVLEGLRDQLTWSKE